MNQQRTHVLGIDFSAAENAGKKIWLASGVIESVPADLSITPNPDARSVRIVSCIRGDELPGSGLELAPALGALREDIAGRPEFVVGMDFPFSLPAPFMPRGWMEFVLGLDGAFANADAFRENCVSRSGDRELKRYCDVKAKTPFCPYNLRMFRQTYFGIRDVLAPLVSAKRIAVVPMQEPVADLPIVAEVCPASLLKSANMYLSYKGQSTTQLAARHRIIEFAIEQDWIIEPEDELRRRIVADDQGDALDSVLAAVCAARIESSIVPAEHAPEGWVYL